ncbi:MAG TPA: sigma-70 family RNA polymerase sigma factor [Bacteroidota bacterium]|nr:sigma-70 family RNA polymerase sigma factor [Bacteroidota bacterium]
MNKPVTDADLIRAFRGGHEDAFEELVRRYQRAIANVIYLTLGDRQEVEDLTQEVFIRAYKSLSRFDESSTLYSWLYRIAVNLCIDEIRRRKIRRTLSLQTLPEGAMEQEQASTQTSSPADDLLREERRAVILKTLERLSPTYRVALILREYEDMSYQQIAQTLHISVQAVKSRIFRARQELKEYLKNYFEERR